ncbi:DUF6379 domain-containing protein [Bacillus sp. B1-b2]|uniref:C-glycoside deglycosidase beta subunit domain-containing protein n=1 Tax=Bacillus sp. B1-b2 TaxID=2653201 RepID=UPI001262357F|nr:DUF6379 domain-containing protein [Bacillus sp. B1-b2]KAB7668369.1 hypothetical protein F9279_13195 [Bacillus sp. B1-b2]
MFDNYVLKDNTLSNVVKDDEVIGYQVQTFITYYRGIPLSMVHDIQIELDDQPVEREKIAFSPDGETFFTLDEMETVTTYKWEYGDPGTIFVKQPGGLSEGKHKVKLTQVSRVPYIPVPFSGTRTLEMEVLK